MVGIVNACRAVLIFYQETVLKELKGICKKKIFNEKISKN